MFQSIQQFTNFMKKTVYLVYLNYNRVFHKHTKLAIQCIVIIANSVFPYICSFLLYLYCMVLVNVKLDVSRNERITFQGCRLYWSRYLSMAQLNCSWQYILAFLYCAELAKNSITIVYFSWKSSEGNVPISISNYCFSLVSYTKKVSQSAS